MKLAWLAATVASLCISTSAAAECRLSIVRGDSPTVTHEPFGVTPTQMSFSVGVRNAGDESCLASLYLLPREGQPLLSDGRHSLAYIVRSPAGLGGGGELGPATVTVPAGELQTVLIDAEIPAGFAAPGDYVGEIGLRLNRDRDLVAQSTMTLRASVPPRVQMSISGARSRDRAAVGAGPALMDLGTLHDGSAATVFVNVWTNSSVRVSIQSENLGVLRLVSNPGLSPIPYVVHFAGESGSLSGPMRAVRSPAETSDGDSYPLSVVVPIVRAPFAGTYRDVLTVSVDNY